MPIISANSFFSRFVQNENILFTYKFVKSRESLDVQNTQIQSNETAIAAIKSVIICKNSVTLIFIYTKN